MTELIFSEMDKEICASLIIKNHLNLTGPAKKELGFICSSPWKRTDMIGR